MVETMSATKKETRFLTRFIYAVVFAVAVVWTVSWLADVFYRPPTIVTPAYLIEIPGGPSAAERARPDVDIAGLQRGWPVTTGVDRATLHAYMDNIEDAKPAAAEAPVAVASAPAEPVIVPDLGTLLASADATAGKKVARKCLSCHTFDQGGRSGVGPNLWGIVGAPRAQVAGFKYSGAMTAFGGSWDFESLNDYLRRPSAYIRGTRMAFAGLRKDADRANLLAYMRSMASSPAPLPAPGE